MGGDHPRQLELRIRSVSGCRIVERQHKRIWETMGLAGGLSTEIVCQSRGIIHNNQMTHKEL